MGGCMSEDNEAVYFKVRNGKSVRQIESGPNGEVIIDVDASGKVMGVEVIL